MTGRTIIGKAQNWRYGTSHEALSDLHPDIVMSDTLALRVAQSLFAREGTASAWGLEIEAADVGFSRVAMTLTPQMLNGHNIAHGGMIFALADSAFAYACSSRNEATVAQACNIVFLDAGQPGERLVAEAHERAVKGRTGIYAITVFGEDGRVIAEMQGQSRTIGGPVLKED
jgi:acyl-CoA thioesterase